jgi:hypothetical protein
LRNLQARYHRAVRKLIKITLTALGIYAFLRWRKKRKAASELEPPSPAPLATDPADELRQKLAESRVEEPEDEPAPEKSVEDRRAEVHEQGHTALDEMKPSNEG